MWVYDKLLCPTHSGALAQLSCGENPMVVEDLWLYGASSLKASTGFTRAPVKGSGVGPVRGLVNSNGDSTYSPHRQGSNP